MSSKPDPYPTPVDVVVYLISAIMNRVIKRFYCTTRLVYYAVAILKLRVVLMPTFSSRIRTANMSWRTFGVVKQIQSNTESNWRPAGCHNDNLLWRRWRQSWHYTSSRFLMLAPNDANPSPIQYCFVANLTTRSKPDVLFYKLHSQRIELVITNLSFMVASVILCEMWLCSHQV